MPTNHQTDRLPAEAEDDIVYFDATDEGIGFMFGFDDWDQRPEGRHLKAGAQTGSTVVDADSLDWMRWLDDGFGAHNPDARKNADAWVGMLRDIFIVESDAPERFLGPIAAGAFNLVFALVCDSFTERSFSDLSNELMALRRMSCEPQTVDSREDFFELVDKIATERTRAIEQNPLSIVTSYPRSFSAKLQAHIEKQWDVAARELIFTGLAALENSAFGSFLETAVIDAYVSFKPCAGFAVLYDESKLDHTIQQEAALCEEGQNKLKSPSKRLNLLNRLKESGPLRPIAPSPTREAILELANDFPNFQVVINYLADMVILGQIKQGVPPRFSPILIHGAPGCGKTEFVRRVARLWHGDLKQVSFGASSAGWTLSGLDSSWSSAKMGMVANALMTGDRINPVILLDEIDKACRNTQFDPTGALYDLLEPTSARNFIDEYLGVEINASHVLWFATANDLSAISEAILSRTRVFKVPDMNSQQLRLALRSLLRGMIAEYELRGCFSDELDEAVIIRLGQIPLRTAKHVLLQGVARAFNAGRRHLEPQDCAGLLGEHPLKKMGFF